MTDNPRTGQPAGCFAPGTRADHQRHFPLNKITTLAVCRLQNFAMSRWYALMFVAAAVFAVAADGYVEEALPIYKETFEKDTEGWSIQWDNNTIAADADLSSGKAAHKSDHGVRVTVYNPEAATSTVRLTSPELELEADHYYTFRFRALSDPEAPVQVLLYNLNETGAWHPTHSSSWLIRAAPPGSGLLNGVQIPRDPRTEDPP